MGHVLHLSLGRRHSTGLRLVASPAAAAVGSASPGQSCLAISANGALVSYHDESQGLIVRHVAEGHASFVWDGVPSCDAAPDFQPDSSLVYAVEDSEGIDWVLHRRDLSTGTDAPIGSVKDRTTVFWGPDRQTLLYGNVDYTAKTEARILRNGAAEVVEPDTLAPHRPSSRAVPRQAAKPVPSPLRRAPAPVPAPASRDLPGSACRVRHVRSASSRVTCALLPDPFHASLAPCFTSVARAMLAEGGNGAARRCRKHTSNGGCEYVLDGLGFAGLSSDLRRLRPGFRGQGPASSTGGFFE